MVPDRLQVSQFFLTNSSCILTYTAWFLPPVPDKSIHIVVLPAVVPSYTCYKDQKKSKKAPGADRTRYLAMIAKFAIARSTK